MSAAASLVGAGTLKVHDEEAEVAGDVRDTQGRVELERVDDLRRVGQEHVLGAQVAVAVDDEAAPPALEQLLAPDGQRRLHDTAQLAQHSGIELVPGLFLEVVECRPHGGPQRRERALRLLRARLGGVEGGQARADGAQLVSRGGTGLEAGGQCVALVVAAHEDGDFDGTGGVVVGIDRQAAVAVWHEAHRRGVELGGQTPVQAQLLSAHGATPLEGAVVKEGDNDRLLDLQRQAARHEHPGPVRLMTDDGGPATRATRQIAQSTRDCGVHGSADRRPAGDAKPAGDERGGGQRAAVRSRAGGVVARRARQGRRLHRLDARGACADALGRGGAARVAGCDNLIAGCVGRDRCPAVSGRRRRAEGSAAQDRRDEHGPGGSVRGKAVQLASTPAFAALASTSSRPACG